MRRALGGVLAAVVTIGLAGCGFGGPDPQPTADAVARALGKHDVHTVEFAGPDAKRATTDLAAILDGMDGVPSTVTASDVQEDGDRATATVTWRWDVAGTTWTTRSPMTLEKADDAWHVVWKPSLVHPKLKPGQALQATTLVAPRGDILGAGGAKIVAPRDVVRYGIDKVHVPHGDAVGSARALASLVGVDPAGFAKRVRTAGEKAFVEAITLRSGSPDAPPDDAVRAIKGAAMVKAQLPLAPTRTFAAPILGTVGTPTAEMVKKSNGTLSAGDQVGLQRPPGEVRRPAGRHLRRPGRLWSTRTASEPTELFRTDPKAGTALTTTLDVRAQDLAERALAGTTSAERAGRDPALDRRHPGRRQRAGPRRATTPPPTAGTHPARPSRSSAALALLRAGVTPTTPVDCPTDRDRRRQAVQELRRLPVVGARPDPVRAPRSPTRATPRSSAQRDRLGRTTLADAAAALGLGVDHDLGFPAYFGDRRRRPARRPRRAADLIGQGKVLASPMTMATVAASVKKGAPSYRGCCPTTSPPRPERTRPGRSRRAEAGRLPRADARASSPTAAAGCSPTCPARP